MFLEGRHPAILADLRGVEGGGRAAVRPPARVAGYWERTKVRSVSSWMSTAQPTCLSTTAGLSAVASLASMTRASSPVSK